ncbi:MAG: hypothetical protein AB1726_08010 [Planctomycetota bacterium]
MDSTVNPTVSTENSRRQYRRRSDDERIAELERRIEDLKAKQAVKKKQTDPVLREIPKVQRRLRRFAQYAMDNNRPDIANSATAFSASLERILRSESNSSPRAAAAPSEE